MSAKYLHFEQAFLPRAEKCLDGNFCAEILPDMDLKPRGNVHDVLLPNGEMRLSPLRITKRRKRI